MNEGSFNFYSGARRVVCELLVGQMYFLYCDQKLGKVTSLGPLVSFPFEPTPGLTVAFQKICLTCMLRPQNKPNNWEGKVTIFFKFCLRLSFFELFGWIRNRLRLPSKRARYAIGRIYRYLSYRD